MTMPVPAVGWWVRLGVLGMCGSVMWGSSPGGLSGQGDSWGLVEELRLSGSDMLPFSTIYSVVIGPDGSAYVTGAGDVAIHVLAPNGDYRGAVGREGDGPGEFRMPPSIGIRNDTLWAIDMAQGSVNYFTLAGRSAGARRVPSISSARGLAMMPIALLDDGGMLLLESAMSGEVIELESEGPFEREVALLSGEVGRVVDVVKLDAATLWLQFALPGGMEAAMPQPWSTKDLLTISPDGGGFVVVRGRGTEQREGQYLLQWFDARGKTRSARSVGFVATQLQESAIELFLNGMSEGFAAKLGGDAESVRRTISRALYTPEYLPGVSTVSRDWSGGGVILAVDGTTWVRQQDADGIGWRVFDQFAQELAQVGPPEDLGLRYIGREYVWGVREGAFGAPEIYRYRISRGWIEPLYQTADVVDLGLVVGCIVANRACDTASPDAPDPAPGPILPWGAGRRDPASGLSQGSTSRSRSKSWGPPQPLTRWAYFNLA